MNPAIPLVLLTRQTGWYGTHSGYYEQLPAILCAAHPRTEVIHHKRTPARRAIGKIYALCKGIPSRDQSLTFAELSFASRMRRDSPAIGNILSYEDFGWLLPDASKLPQKVIGTLHFPRSAWLAPAVRNLERLSSAIVLYRRDLDFFERHVGAGRVRFVPHGVDTDFFRPSEVARNGTPRIVFAGQFLRNLPMLCRIVLRLVECHREIEFDFVVPRHAAGAPELRQLRALPSIRWHHGISDEELLRIYQRADLMLLPMNDSGANNSVVEALACGLPLATTDVGGVRDYGGGSIFPVVGNDEDDLMMELVGTYLSREGYREEVSRNMRGFAVEYLSWPRSAEAHLQAYASLASS